MRKLSTIALVVILITVAVFSMVKLTGRGKKVTDIAALQDRGELRVALNVNLPGYLTVNGESCGFQYDVLREYADHLHLDLRIVPEKSTEGALALLDAGEVDMVATMPGYVDTQNRTILSSPAYNTGYVLLSSSRVTPLSISVPFDSLKGLVEGRRVVLSRDFASTRLYERWLDRVSTNSTITYDNDLNGLVASLVNGDIDFVVCNRLEAQLARYLYPSVRRLYSFDESVSAAVVVRQNDEPLKDNFNCWVSDFKTTDRFAALYDIYYGDDVIRHYMDGLLPDAEQPAISKYDDIIKRASLRAGRDWRLISAIAYNESRFKPDVVSPKGATGIMQVMPAIARQFGHTVEQMTDAETNIETALKLISNIEDLLHFSSETSEYDRLCIMLACYNGGVGHVLDARRLARKYGDNPDLWSNVSKYLVKKAEAKYYQDEAVRAGRFLGSDETCTYVARVMKKFDHYRSQVD